MKSKMSSITLKMLLVGFLVLMLLIPLMQIQSIVDERELRLAGVVSKIAESWGGEQIVGAPILLVPYRSETAGDASTQYAFFLADTASIEVEVFPEVRKLGIFEALLYTANIKIQGRFQQPDFKTLGILPKNILWQNTFLIFGLKDNQGLKDFPNVVINGQNLVMKPLNFYFDKTIGGSVDMSQNINNPIEFSMSMKLNGQGALHIIPNAKTFSASMQSSWPNPSFSGHILPISREITTQGFQAQWKSTYLNRDYPQTWKTEFPSDSKYFDSDDYVISSKKMLESAFEMRLANPVDAYQITTRSMKYDFLFIGLILSIFFLFEVLCEERLHPIQYLFVGFAICLFFLMLLALSEHFVFALAYFVASLAVTLLIGVYSSWILKENRHGLWIGAWIGGLFLYLYVLLQIEDYALLMGSLGLFAILASVMIFTRKVRWYNLDSTHREKEVKLTAGTSLSEGMSE